ncbi:hypothetical protein HYPSUDRAFT_174441 [Hypholoma sublateritium FD-334 SS-4]|uniref:Thioredoxin-like fold domain-containing protein n=1 Tax=Hypholoma sublateritium (strain FD-334 SS-4) TaxID=945553 RepID=A0A0D2QDK2_HYPSF|nr:hypothetical protein HYPSUDRAFT_174441 [Hypholoma sublateritium FD-334 SS-4]
MALQPSLRAQLILGAPDAPHTLDVFVDYVCPYSAKIALRLDRVLAPLLAPGGAYAGKVKVILRLHPQPWHAVSTLVHEAALAVLRVSPAHFWPFSLELFKHQEEYFDVPTQDLSIREIRARLAQLAGTVLPGGAAAADQVTSLLTLASSPNGGTAVTDDLKYNVKFARQNGIHVSPTVLWDGLVQNQVSSGWEAPEWSAFLAKQVTA